MIGPARQRDLSLIAFKARQTIAALLGWRGEAAFSASLDEVAFILANIEVNFARPGEGPEFPPDHPIFGMVADWRERMAEATQHGAAEIIRHGEINQ